MVTASELVISDAISGVMTPSLDGAACESDDVLGTSFSIWFPSSMSAGLSSSAAGSSALSSSLQIRDLKFLTAAQKITN